MSSSCSDTIGFISAVRGPFLKISEVRLFQRANLSAEDFGGASNCWDHVGKNTVTSKVKLAVTDASDGGANYELTAVIHYAGLDDS